jgi:hypothetical protein
MSQSTFAELQQQLADHGVESAIGHLGDQLKQERKYHELFDVLLMGTRHRLGLPVILSTPLDDLPEPQRTRLEEAYLAACRDVGTLLLADGKLREAWMYLRPVGDRALVADALGKMVPNDENLQDMIEIALHEGVAPALGFELVLKNYGTCNAITTFEGALTSRSRSDQQAGAAMLLRQLHADVLNNVRSDIARQEGSEPAASHLAELVADRDWLFADNNYHIDTTHLAATIRFARLLDEPALIELAWDLTEYGRRLSAQFQFAGDEPFVDVYKSHGLFFAAQLGRQIDAALEYFADRARAVDVQEQGAAAAEVYVALLARLGRYDEAMTAAAEHIPPGARLSGFAPSLFELARLGDGYDRLLAICQQRGDLVGYAAALVEQHSHDRATP